MTTEKTLIVHFGVENILILVPKKRGTGFQKVPLGHHVCDLSNYISEHVRFDVFGLDGMLTVDTGYIESKEYPELEGSVVKPLSEYYGYSYRVVSHTEFWKHHKAGQ